MTPDRPLSVLHVAVPGRAGGLETVLVELAGGLKRRGHRTVLAAVVEGETEAHPVLVRAAELHVEVHGIVASRRAYLREYLQLRKTIDLTRPDVVHTHGYRADFFGGLAARGAGVPWVSTAHGFTGGGRKNQLYEWLQVRAYRRAQRVVAVSKSIRDRLMREGVSGPRILLLPNAWAPRRILSREEARSRLAIPQGQFVVGWVGRLSPEKGADVFLDALGGLPELPWQAAVVGDGREHEALKAMALALRVSDRVRWYGAISNASTLFAAFDAFVLSSHTEGTPITLLEAVAARVPVVATAVGGVPDMFSRESVLLVPPGRPDSISAALRNIFNDPAAARVRSETAFQELVQRFDLDSWLAAHVELYSRIATQRRGTA